MMHLVKVQIQSGVVQQPVRVIKADFLDPSKNKQLQYEPLEGGQVALVEGAQILSYRVQGEGGEEADYSQVVADTHDTPHQLLSSHWLILCFLDLVLE